MMRLPNLRTAGLMLLATVVLAALSGRAPRAAGQAAAPAEGGYRLVENWPTLPPGKKFGTLTGVAIDAKGTVYTFLRDTGEVWTFDQSGKWLGVWGDSAKPGFVKMAHTIHVDRNGFIWITDQNGHQVKKFTPDGKLLLTLGKFGVAGTTPDTFNGPTGVQVLENGDFIISDGYWNSRVLRFNKDGKFLKSFGSWGREPGQLGLVHAAVQDSRGHMIVVDRCDGPVGPDDETRRSPGCKDTRVQVLDQDGKHLAFWNHVRGALALTMAGERVFVGETGTGNVVVLDAATGKEIERIEKTGQGHQISLDTQGDVYIAVLGNSGGQRSGGNGTVRRYTKRPR